MSARTFVQVIAVVAPRRNAVGGTRMMPNEVAGHAAACPHIDFLADHRCAHADTVVVAEHINRRARSGPPGGRGRSRLVNELQFQRPLDGYGLVTLRDSDV